LIRPLTDELQHIVIWKQALESEGFEVILYDDPQQIWDIIIRPPYKVDAIIMDLLMDPPDELKDLVNAAHTDTGVFMVKRIAQIQAHQDLKNIRVPVAVLTRVDDKEVLNRVRQIIADVDIPVRLWLKSTNAVIFTEEFNAWLDEVM
jgi:CheY-like chemotaxis protein